MDRNELETLDLKDPDIAWGVISGYPSRNDYPISDKKVLRNVFDYGWSRSRETASAAIRCEMKSETTNSFRFRYAVINGLWAYKGVNIFDRGFLFIGDEKNVLEHIRSIRPDPCFAFKPEGKKQTVIIENAGTKEELNISSLSSRKEIVAEAYGMIVRSPNLTDYRLLELRHHQGNSFFSDWPQYEVNLKFNGTPVWGPPPPVVPSVRAVPLLEIRNKAGRLIHTMRTDHLKAALEDAAKAGADMRAVILDTKFANSDDRRSYVHDIAGIDLSGVDLSRASFFGERLESANFSGSNLTGADFTDADLADADFTGASLRYAKLHGANFENAKLYGITIDGKNTEYLVKRGFAAASKEDFYDDVSDYQD
jgi:hypothetical protein